MSYKNQHAPENGNQDSRGPPTASIQKNFFNEHEDTKNRSEEDVKKFLRENEIKVEGHDIPRPVQTFKESSLPKYLVDQLSSHFEKPSTIQS